ncbi:molybdopterin molybdotransferase MoeA [Rubellicoccus peritrichatus]|uniref:Molybdopterin molybdenumtransferase n=1 Tax=Rubellicoccus peritrichatus TaxID=3080537 RepID=A0AAQ3LCL1_9BACT|nr:molybdopterin molybdotransferase MoeA [Puniceicoccus sp. CR14]WOO42897.1 molybdopterin molybdotransferase MoeA [Puniceicoccus sp. CR14]
MKALISSSEASKLILAEAQATPSIRCPLNRAAGRILREDIVADRDLPPFDRAMMDGYAIRTQNAEAKADFVVTGQAFAGSPQITLSEATSSAIEIMTGAPIPQGADAVIPYEWTKSTSNDAFTLTSNEPVSSGLYIHRRASDYPNGTVLVKKGTRLGPAEAGIAASCGYAEPIVNQLPRIAILGSGDELVPVETNPEPHQIRQSNAFAVENALANAGYPVGKVAFLSDDESAARPELEAIIGESDIIIISGAVSKGRKDWVPNALNSIAENRFHGVAQRPGKPLGFWKHKDGSVIFGLPGNPVSSLVGTHRYILPYLNAIAGKSESTIIQNVCLAATVQPLPKLTFFLPFRFNNDGNAIPAPVNNSGDYASLTGTVGFLEIPAGDKTHQPGETFPYYLWT